MNRYSTYISTGNCLPLNRSRSEIKESIEIVAGNADAPYVYDTFSFVASEFSALEPFETEADEFLLGTGTTSCFTWDDSLVGGLLISLPLRESVSTDATLALVDEYISKFGDSLIATFEQRPQEYDDEIGDLTTDELGFDTIDVPVVDERTITDSRAGATIKVVSFRSDSTLNLLYLLSEGNGRTKRYRSLVRHMDTMAVFESPEAADKTTGTTHVPCQRVLNSTQFQSYMESQYRFSVGTRANLSDVTNPELFLDSRLSFTFSPAMGADVSVELIGSKNAHQIESRVRENSRDIQDIDTDPYVTIMGGVVGEKWDKTGNVFIGQVESNWACGCESKFCPTVITITTDGEITADVLSSVDDILQEVTGQTPLEVEVGGNRLETVV